MMRSVLGSIADPTTRILWSSFRSREAHAELVLNAL